MVHYIHHVPGRLRVKSPVLKSVEAKARRAEAYMKRVPGVLSAEASPLTGSIVIRYQPGAVEPQALLARLHEHGVISEAATLEQPLVSTATTQVGNAIADVVVEKLVRTVIERSAITLIGVLI